jgi:hypothetical protein
VPSCPTPLHRLTTSKHLDGVFKPGNKAQWMP